MQQTSPFNLDKSPRPSLAQDLLAELLELQRNQQQLHTDEQYKQLRSILEWLCRDLTKNERMHISGLFGRLVFIAGRFNLSKQHSWQLQKVRAVSNQVRQSGYKPKAKEVDFAIQVLIHTIARCYQQQADIPDLPLPQDLYAPPTERPWELPTCLRARIVRKLEGELLCAIDMDDAREEVRVRHGIDKWNSAYDATIEILQEGDQLNLLDVKMDGDGCYLPRHIILEPDYLIDVTAVSECLTRDGAFPLLYLLRKFQPSASSLPMHLGNVANFLLDELVHAPDVEQVKFMDLFARTFQLYALTYATLPELDDKERFKQFMYDAARQFDNLKRALVHDLAERELSKDSFYIEPSFYASRLGLQGRLDLLYQAEEGRGFAYEIVELKSGKAPVLNMFGSGLWSNHEAQAALYRCMIEWAYGLPPEKINTAILYSAASEHALRFAPHQMALEQQLLNLRNRIVHLELQLCRSTSVPETMALLQQLNPNNFPGAAKFTLDALREFQDALHRLPALERSYLHAFLTFIAREQQLSKMGDSEFSRGLASLWLDDFRLKAENFELFYDLALEENGSDQEPAFLRFRRTNPDNEFVNFREGDIGVLFPKNEQGHYDLLAGQVFKCTVAEVTPTHVLVRFRYKQKNKSHFEKYAHWCIEHDQMDGSYQGMIRGLFSFVGMPDEQRRRKLLGALPPAQPAPAAFTPCPGDRLNEEERRILGKALAAEDYFLLVGPPGTGKTSRMLKNLVANLHADPDRNILLMAYTNRAVDEICEAVSEAIAEEVEEGRKFLRISTELGTEPRWRHSRLDAMAEEVKTRQELKERIGRFRIFIGTVASISGKHELFRLKDFDVAIIDEASQILEPHIIGLLPKVRRFIMIGDHKQLPAIVQQEPEVSAIRDPHLEQIGLRNRRNSYFERMYQRCEQENWHMSFDTLSHQGRMHADIGSIASDFFYDERLHTVPLPWQSAPLQHTVPASPTGLDQLLAEHRLLYIPTSRDLESGSNKVNVHEAQLAAQLCELLIARLEREGKPYNPRLSIGIIAPYRNQIAQIRSQLQQRGVPGADQITIDTVERYQGSQRDVIILSFCCNTPSQVGQLMSLSDDGRVDRKLNVAITRARQQMVVLGNEALLRRSPIFAAFLDRLERE